MHIGTTKAVIKTAGSLVTGAIGGLASAANDIAGLLYDQVAHDEAIKVAIDFAEKDKNTLVIITTDHGNANPGIIYGKDANTNFDSIQKYKQTNDWILNGIDSFPSTTDDIL